MHNATMSIFDAQYTKRSAEGSQEGERPPKHYPMPMVRIELAVYSVQAGKLAVLLSRRRHSPFKGHWGLPGGVLRIDLDGSLDSAPRRVALERLQIDLPNLEQVMAVGGAQRDPRSPWTMSIVYRSIVQPNFTPSPGKRVASLGWYDVDHVFGDTLDPESMAFDHREVIGKATEALRADVRELRYPRGCLEEPFTVAELQRWSEAVLGSPLDKVTFRRRLDIAQPLQPEPGAMRTGAHRPAQLFSFRSAPV